MDVSSLSLQEKGIRPAPSDLLDRMVRAVERVRKRLLVATAALEAAGVPHAVIGEQAVAAWVTLADEAAVRNSPQVDILLNRSDLRAAKSALASAGFIFQHIQGIDVFVENLEAPARDAIRIAYAGERDCAGDLLVAPEIRDSERGVVFQVIALEPLVRMKLACFRLIDRVNLGDMIDVGLVDESWLTRFAAPLSERLKELLDNPEG